MVCVKTGILLLMLMTWAGVNSLPYRVKTVGEFEFDNESRVSEVKSLIHRLRRETSEFDDEFADSDDEGLIESRFGGGGYHSRKSNTKTDHYHRGHLHFGLPGHLNFHFGVGLGHHSKNHLGPCPEFVPLGHSAEFHRNHHHHHFGFHNDDCYSQTDHGSNGYPHKGEGTWNQNTHHNMHNHDTTPTYPSNSNSHDNKYNGGGGEVIKPVSEPNVDDIPMTNSGINGRGTTRTSTPYPAIDIRAGE